MLDAHTFQLAFGFGIALSSAIQVLSFSVPEGDGSVVVLDGVIERAEWADAGKVSINDSVGVYLKGDRENLFVGIDFEFEGPRTAISLFLRLPGEGIRQLLVSDRLGERTLDPHGEPNPDLPFGNPRGWEANIIDPDQHGSGTHSEWGGIMGGPMRPRSSSGSGVEFRILRSMFPSQEWLARIELWVPASTGSQVVFPRGGFQEREGWLGLDLSGLR